MLAPVSRRIRFAPLAIVVLLLASWTPVATAQDNLIIDLVVPRGEVNVYRSSGDPPMPFVNENETAYISVKVVNRGPSDAVGIPIYVWSGNGANDIRLCIQADIIPGADTSSPGERVFTRTLPTGMNIRDGLHILNVTVNEDPQSSWGYDSPTSNGPRCQVQAKSEPQSTSNERDHTAWTFLVKKERPDLVMERVVWCSADGSNGCDASMVENGEWINTTAYGTTQRNTFFQLYVENHGSYQDLTDWSSSRCSYAGSTRFAPTNCGTLRYDMNLTVAGPGIPGKLNLSVGLSPVANPTPGSNATVWQTTDWSLNGRGGNYTVTATIDPLGRTIRQGFITNDVLTRLAHVRTTEFRVDVDTSQFKQTATDPYAFQAGTLIGGTVAFWNDGSANISSSRSTSYRIYIDSPTGDFVHTASLTRDSGDLRTDNRLKWVHFNFTTSTDVGAQFYLAPGRHTLVFEIDPANTSYELNESDNRVEIPIFIEDTGKPFFPTYVTNPVVRASPTAQSSTTGPSDTTIHPRQPIRIHARVNDTDTNLVIRAVFSLANETNVTRTYNLTRRADPEGNHFFTTISDFSFYGENETKNASQTWNLRIYAEDPTGNNATSPTTAITMERWPLHSAPEDYIVLNTTRGMPQNATMNYTDPTGPRFHIFLPSNLTGFTKDNVGYDNHNSSANLALDLDPPGDDHEGRVRAFNGTHWNHPSTRACGPPTGEKSTPVIGEETVIDNCPDYGQWVISFSQYDYRPGKFNATIKITDLGGATRLINRTFTLVDELPNVRDFRFSKGTINATEAVNLTVEVDDDFTTVAAHANFTRADGAYRNVTLTKSNGTEFDSRELTWWNLTLQTGRGQVVDLAGNLTVRIDAKDENGNWGSSFERNLVVLDSTAPSITNTQVSPPTQEVGGNVTWRATIADQTNVTAVLVLSRSGEEVFNSTMTWLGGSNYTYTRNFTQPETYSWKIVAYDGNPNGGLVSNEVGGIVSIQDNVGPRYELVDPGFRFNGERFGRAAQRIALIVYDNDHVDPTSIRVSLDGVPLTDLERAAAPAGYRGYTVSYQVPATAGYTHNDTVRVDVSATDLSNKSLTSEQSFTYRVDDRAPSSRVVAFEPRHRDLEGQAWNVSLETLFTLAATDNDGMPTGVETIRFQVIGGSSGSGSEQVYEKPFTLLDIANAYTGPRPYLLQFWAEDDVGNRERPTQQVNLYVDDTAPVLDPFGSLPQGRYINATFLDDRSGIDRAVVWYSLNGSTYLPLPLEPEGQVWKAVLPEGKKGEQMAYYLQAWDRVNNTQRFGNETEPYSSYVEGNHLPQLRIVSPALGGTVSRMMQLTWSAVDEDDDALTFLVYLRAPGRANFVELARLDVSSARSYSLDTSRYPDGQYTLALTASDGSFVARAETTVTFLNSGRAVNNVTAPQEAKLGEGVLITAEVTKAQARVEARIIRSGVLVDAFAMNDEGREGDLVAGDNIYSVRVVLSRAGDYSVEIVTQYQEAGEAKESVYQNAAAFTVALTPGAIFTEYAWLWVGIVVLALAAIGVAGFGLYRKWR